MRTPTLPDAARAPGMYRTRYGLSGPYPVCLPRPHAELNLLPDVRSGALGLFNAESIAWHDGVNGGPSNHLLDSQVQCVNALWPGTTDPAFVKEAFGAAVPLADVLPIERDRFLTFEYIGARDYLSERRGLSQTRGSLTTSADAAFRYRSTDGVVEVALVEWKFTEDYRDHELAPARGEPRPERYRALWEDADCPLRRDLIPYEDLFVEPFYQLFRQQLLAWSMERWAELDAGRVRVVHLCPAANEGVHTAFNRDSQRAAGSDVMEVWSKMLLHPDRFVSADTALFNSLRGSDYKDRYEMESRGCDDGTHQPTLPCECIAPTGQRGDFHE